jgi:hypothetical protein
MKTVFKYEINPLNAQTILPKHAEILTVAFQRQNLFMWCLVDTDYPVEAREFHVFGTGHEIQQGVNYSYIGTGFMDIGLVFHVFEKVTK